jgi:hypothetical protein
MPRRLPRAQSSAVLRRIMAAMVLIDGKARYTQRFAVGIGFPDGSDRTGDRPSGGTVPLTAVCWQPDLATCIGSSMARKIATCAWSCLPRNLPFGSNGGGHGYRARSHYRPGA